MPAAEAILGGDFIPFARSILPRTVTEMVLATGSPAQWEAGFNAPALGGAVAQTAAMLALLASTAGEREVDGGGADGANGGDAADPEEAAAAFLTDGDHVTRMLKEFGDALDAALLPSARAPPAASVAVLRGVLVLQRLAGRFLGRFLPQLMVLLGAAVRPRAPPPLRALALEGWLGLVRALAARAPVQLGGVAAQVVVALMDCLAEGGAPCAGAAAVVEELVAVCAREYPAKLRALPPLPQGPAELAAARAALAEHRGSLTAAEHAELLLESLDAAQAPGVRAVALGELRALLAGRRDWLTTLTAAGAGAAGGGAADAGAAPAAPAAPGGAEGGEALLQRLVAALLKACEPEAGSAVGAAAQQACAECLGMLGALDPARVRAAPPPPPAMLPAAELVTSLLARHLVRLLKTAPNLQTLDATTFAIQELLKAYAGGLPAPPGAAAVAAAGGSAAAAAAAEAAAALRRPLFEQLAEEVRAVVRPYLDSKYSVRGSARRPAGPVYAAGLPFRRWLATWLAQLASAAEGDAAAAGAGAGAPGARPGSAAGAAASPAAADLAARLPVFRAVVPVLRFDVAAAMFVAPYLVHSAVAAGAGAAVVGELEAVLEADPSSRDGALCLQAAFALLDVLGRWAEDARAAAKAEAASASARSSASRLGGAGGAGAGGAGGAGAAAGGWDRLGEVLAGVPREALARAAARAGAHARALRHFEAHARAARGGGANVAAARSAAFSDEEVSFLIEAYGALEEPDGLEGLVKLRRGGPTEADQRLAAEAAGSWGEALTLYERELARAGGEAADGSSAGGLSPAQRGQLECLLQMGHWQGLLTQVAGLGAEAGPGAPAAPQLAALGAAAAWRLGRWSALGAFVGAAGAGFASLDAEGRWEVRLGRLLAAAAAGDGAALERELAAARAGVMGPLGAAAMESYARAHPHLVKLHMLQEAADAAALLGRPAGARERARALRWDARLAATQPSLAARAPVLALRRQLAALAGAPPGEAGAAWLALARLCRATGHLDAAAPAVLEAAAVGVPGAALERLELLRARGEPHRALVELAALEARLASGGGGGDALAGGEPARARDHARAALALARWTAEAGQGARDEVVGLFERALAARPGSEAALFHYAAYLDREMAGARARQGGGGKAGQRLGGTRGQRLLVADRPHVEWLPEVRC
jgi:serine/threonine-protein kinase ATR